MRIGLAKMRAAIRQRVASRLRAAHWLVQVPQIKATH